MFRVLVRLVRLLPLLAASALPAHAALDSVLLDFESNWADLAPNTFVRIDALVPAPGGLHWGDAWFGQTTVPAQGSNNELRLGAGNFGVDYFDNPFYLDSVEFRSLQNGGSIAFDMIVQTYDATQANGAGHPVVYSLKIDGAPDVALPPLHFTPFTEAAALGQIRGFSFGNFKAGGQTTDRNLFVMDNLRLRLEARVTPVPETGTASMLFLGLGVVGSWLQRRRVHA